MGPSVIPRGIVYLYFAAVFRVIERHALGGVPSFIYSLGLEQMTTRSGNEYGIYAVLGFYMIRVSPTQF